MRQISRSGNHPAAALLLAPLLLVHCLVVLSAPVTGQESARSISFSPEGREIVEHKLLTLGKTDRWDLRVEAGEVLWCKVESDLFDPVLELTNSDGLVLASDDGVGTKSSIWRRIEHSGPVAFRVRGFEGSGGGRYRFWLRRYRCQDVVLDSVTHHRFGQEAWWHFAIPLHAGDVFVPSVEGQARIAAVFAHDQTPLPEIMGGYRIERDGCYLVRVEGPYRKELDFHCHLARQRILHQLPVDDGVVSFGMDAWSCSLQKGEAYAVEIQMPGESLEYDLRERHPKRGIAFAYTGSLDKGGSRRRWLVARRDCDLVLTVRNRSPNPAPYRLSLRVPGKVLKDGVQVRAELPLGGGRVYRLPTTPGQLLRLSMNSTAFDGQIDLWGPEGRVLVRCDDAGPMDRNPSFTYLVTKPGVHRALVFSPGGCGGGAYSLCVESLEVPRLGFETALELAVSETSTRYSHLQLKRDQEVWLSVKGAGVDVSLSVLAPDGRVVGHWDGGGLGTDVLAALKASTTGRYTLQISSRRGQGSAVIRAVQP